MNAIEILKNEHGLIRQYLDNLNIALDKLENGEKIPRDFFDNCILFARSFTDKYHHYKEEHVMFELLAQKKSGLIDAEITALRYQHERGRTHIARISELLDGYEREQSTNVSDLIENLGAYIHLLRAHMHKEDHVFYPMVLNELSENETEKVLGEFHRGKEKCGTETFQESQTLVNTMGNLLT